MALSELKQELIEKINASDDEDLLQMLKADLDDFSSSEKDVFDELSPEDREDLNNLLSEPFGHNTITQEELNEAIKKCFTK